MPNWYMITNRQRRKRNTEYGTDPQPNGAIDLLIGRGDDRPKSASDFDRITKPGEFVKEIVSELQQQGRMGKRPTLVCYIHGFNNDFDDAVAEYVELWDSISELRPYANKDGFHGIIVGFTWPSEGAVYEYREDRDDAIESASAFIHTMSLLRKASRLFRPFTHRAAPIIEELDKRDCPANVAIISHSMGNYVLREALRRFGRMEGYPIGSALIQQAIMLAADIGAGSLEPGGSGAAITHYAYRTTVYYSKHDWVLGASRFKHIGSRRLGRHGPSNLDALPSGVVALDCSKFINEESVGSRNKIHGAYRTQKRVVSDIVDTINGADRLAIPGRQIHPERPGSPDKRNSLALV